MVRGEDMAAAGSATAGVEAVVAGRGLGAEEGQTWIQPKNAVRVLLHSVQLGSHVELFRGRRRAKSIESFSRRMRWPARGCTPGWVAIHQPSDRFGTPHRRA
jgi:hypothetical protein